MREFVVATLGLAFLACGGIVERPGDDFRPGVDADAGSLQPDAQEPQKCEMCVDRSQTYCGDSRCLTGAEYCAIYGCSPCAACGELSCMVNVCGDPWY